MSITKTEKSVDLGEPAPRGLNVSQYSLFTPEPIGSEDSYEGLETNANLDALQRGEQKDNPSFAAAYAFRRRFGIDRLIYKNDDMIKTLKDPTSQLGRINRDYNKLTMRLTKLWREVYLSLLQAGYSKQESKRRADEYIAPLIIAETKLIKARHPFALSSGKKGEKSDMMEQLFQRLKGAKQAGTTAQPQGGQE